MIYKLSFKFSQVKINCQIYFNYAQRQDLTLFDREFESIKLAAKQCVTATHPLAVSFFVLAPFSTTLHLSPPSAFFEAGFPKKDLGKSVKASSVARARHRSWSSREHLRYRLLGHLPALGDRCLLLSRGPATSLRLNCGGDKGRPGAGTSLVWSRGGSWRGSRATWLARGRPLKYEVMPQCSEIS